MLLLGVAVAGCGSGVSTVGADDPVPVPAGATTPVATTTSGTEMTGDLEGPPPFRLRYDDQEVVLWPHTFCYDNGCADGAPTDVVSVGSPAEVRVFVPVDGWDLDATFVSGDPQCGRRQTVRPEGTDGWYVLRPVGRAGDQRVDLFASGGGDMIAAFDWQTTADGALPRPEALTALIADHDGRPDSYGVELSLVNLAGTPEEATAEVTVTAANGRSLTFDAHRSVQDCQAEGTVYFDGPDRSGRDVADLGGFPFRYDIVVTLDGTTHRATARYPADEIVGNEPSVRLDFDPPLPALR